MPGRVDSSTRRTDSGRQYGGIVICIDLSLSERNDATKFGAASLKPELLSIAENLPRVVAGFLARKSRQYVSPRDKFQIAIDFATFSIESFPFWEGQI